MALGRENVSGNFQFGGGENSDGEVEGNRDVFGSRIREMLEVEMVVFDADLTLIDSFAGVHKIYCGAAEKLGLRKPSRRELKVQWGKKIPEIISGLFSGVSVEEAIKVIGEVAGDYRHPLFPGTAEALKSISVAGFKLGILSTSNKELIIPHLEAAGVASLFEIIVGGEDTSERKPHPSVFDPFLNSWKKHNMVYVGDALVDWEAARDAGLGLFLAVTTGHTSRDEFLLAGVPENQVLESVASVPQILEALKMRRNISN